MLKIYHNPRCTKSRQTLKLIEDKGVEVEIIQYLKDNPTKEELKAVLAKLGVAPEKILRKGEQIFKDNFKGKTFSDDEWLDILVANPKLIERPIVFDDKKAVIGRPPENVEELF